MSKETDKLVGFATTKEDLDTLKIASIQPIYFSTDKDMCGGNCLLENPIVTSHTKRIEPPPENETWLEKLDREGNLENFVLACFSLFGLILISGIVVIILCRLQKKEPQRLRLAFDPRVYINLEEKTKVRNKDIIEKINDVQKNGYKPKIKNKDDLFVINEVIEVGGD